MLTIWCYLLGIVISTSTPPYEQLTTDFFFQTIWKQKYLEYKSIEFDKKAVANINPGHVYGCKQWTDVDKKDIVSGKAGATVALNISAVNILIKKRSASKRLKLTIGTRIRLDEIVVVQIDVYKPFQFVDHYFIKLDKDGRVIDVCETSEVI